ETNNVVLMSGEKEPPLSMDMSLLIPVAASALAVTLPYATVPYGRRWIGRRRPQRNETFLPQNMKDRPLPKPGTLKKQRDSHIYDSPQ
ncbi:hypothetical protein TNIN_87191, partial [Trichonephila inaurata madagascariensis]